MSPTSPTGGPGRGRSALRRVAVVVAAFVLGGALAGAAWELLWTPPLGVALDGRFVFTSAGLAASFGGTALYAIVGFAAGLVLGVGVALRAEGVELATLGGVVAGSLLAAGVMAAVGIVLGPPDADAAARGREDYTPVRQDLRVEGAAAYLAFPSGALLGLGGVFVSLARPRRGAGDGKDSSGAAEG